MGKTFKRGYPTTATAVPTSSITNAEDLLHVLLSHFVGNRRSLDEVSSGYSWMCKKKFWRQCQRIAEITACLCPAK
jgi:hypothetical protein